MQYGGRKSALLCCALLFLAFYLSCGGGQNLSGEISGQNPINDQPFFPETGNSCTSNYELLSVSPVDLARVDHIEPLGRVNPSEHTFPTSHTYLYSKNSTDLYSLYAPGDMQIYSLGKFQYSNGSEDYQITFSFCDEVIGYFNHVKTFSDSILSKIGAFTDCQTYNPGNSNVTMCHQSVSIDVKAGDVLGEVNTFDFGMRDQRREAIHYVAPDRMPDDTYPYIVCPYDYYPEGNLKSSLQDKILSSIENPCYEVVSDKEGFLFGRWYQEGSSGNYESGHIAFVPYHQNPSKSLISVGNFSLGVTTVLFTPQASGQYNRDFSNVTSDGNSYCYSGGGQGYYFLQMTNEKRLMIQKSSTGSCPTNPNSLSFTGSAIVFER